MPAVLEKTWQTEGNVLVDEASANACSHKVLWLLKALLVGDVSSDGAGGTVADANGKTGLWTVYGSSDGVTAGLDGVDRWGTTFDDSKFVDAATNQAHSWIVLRSPDALGPYYMVLDKDTGGAAGALGAAKMKLVFSKAAPTGGSVTNRPAAGDDWVPANNTTSFVNAVASAFRCNLILCTDGTFWYTVSEGGTGTHPTIIGLQAFASPRVGDQYPVVGCLAYSSLDGGAFVISTSTSAPLYCNSTSRCLAGRRAVAGFPAQAFGGLWAASFNTTSANVGALLNADGPGPSIDGTYDEIPLFVVDPNNGGIRGRIPDAYIVAPDCPEGSVAVDADGKIYASCVSDAWLPWTATYTPIV